MPTPSFSGPAAARLTPPASGTVSLVAAAVPPLRHDQRRPIRVVCLTIAIALLSLADLHITMLYLRTVGMGEANPIARFVMEHGSETLLIAWKCASVSVACLVFFQCRRHRVAELAAWFALAVLVWLLVRWMGYADEVWRLTPALHTLSEVDSALWVRLGE
jgi:hypothetical protein